MNQFAGLNIVPHPLAREVRTEWRVERMPIPKRRRRWRVVRHDINRPGCYIVGGHTVYMHPELYAKFRAAALSDGADGKE